MRKPRMLWTKAEDEILMLQYGKIPAWELCRKLNRSYGAITQRVAYLRRKARK